jgi:acyl-CoA reductase-like NAD-dependent aldehyde dehydrogenase
MFGMLSMPDGVFQVLHGDREVVSGLLTHPDVDGICFVGSTPVAKHNATDHLAAAVCGIRGQNETGYE